MVDELHSERTTDPAQAFDDLRAEVSVLRRAVEALPDLIAQNKPADYGPDLGIIGQGLDAIVNQLNTIQKSPALVMTPAEQGQSIAHAGSAMLREATQKLDSATGAADRERDNLRAVIGTARSKDEQRRWVIRAALAGLVIGLFLFPMIAHVLPFGLNQIVAARIAGTGR
jgi:Family of unknown function (DUF6118)